MIEVFSPRVAREPRAGDIYEFTTRVTIVGAHVERGSRLKLLQKTEDTPHGYHNPKGNFWAQVDNGLPTVWSSIHTLIHMDWVKLVKEGPAPLL